MVDVVMIKGGLERYICYRLFSSRFGGQLMRTLGRHLIAHEGNASDPRILPGSWRRVASVNLLGRFLLSVVR